MALKICLRCWTTISIVNGPRGLKVQDCCAKCRPGALMDLAVEGMLNRDEADELNALLDRAVRG